MSDAGVGWPALLAASPVALVLALMLGLQWSAARAGAAGLLLATAVAAHGGFFGAERLEPLLGVAAEGAFTTATILWILWPALALHHLQQGTGALDDLRAGLSRLSPHPLLQVLLVGWFLALFFEGAAGFGTPVAVAAPLMVGMGIAPVPAVVLALLGHASGVSFGALGTPALAQAALTGLPVDELAWRTALLHAVTGGLLMAFFLRAVPATGEPGPGPSPAAWGALAAAAYLLPSLLIALWLGPELATLGAALAGGLLVALLMRARGGAGHRPPSAGGLLRALSPYLVLVALVIASRLPLVAAALGVATIEWRWLDAFSGRMLLLNHPGTLLLAALLLGGVLQRAPAREVGAALAASARRLVPVAAALIAMLCLSRLMLHAGLVGALERAAVHGVGASWPWVAPAVGALGSFVTGSGTASNILFTSLQAQTAQALALPVPLVVAAQNFGAAVGNIVCPHNIVAGAATVGLAGREAEVLRRTLLPCLLHLLVGGALVAWLAHRWLPAA